MARRELTPEEQAIAANLGARIRRYRQERGLTQAQLSVYADIGLRTLANVERGDSLSHELATLSKIAGALEIEVSAFFVPADRPDKEYAAGNRWFQQMLVYQHFNVLDAGDFARNRIGRDLGTARRRERVPA